MIKRPIAYGSAALVAALLLLATQQDDPGPARGPAPMELAPPAAAPESGRATRASPPATPPATASPITRGLDPATIAQLRRRLAASSLRGASADGEVRFDAGGALVLDQALVRRFEHYLSLLGEFSADEIRELLQAQLREEHGHEAADRVMAAFDRYLGLRQAIAETELAPDLGQRLEHLRRLRRQWFGDDAQAMFGVEEAELAHRLARSELLREPDLAPDARAARLAALEATRGPVQREAQREATVVLLANEQTRQFEQLGIDADTRAEERRALWGEAAAQRLAVLDQARASWELRVAEYTRERERLRADPRLDAAARARQLAHLRERRFDAQERQRIEALEAVGALPPSG